MHPVVSWGLSNFNVVEQTVQHTPAQQTVVGTASHFVGSTAMIHTLTSRACASSPYPTRAHMSDSVPSIAGALLDSLVAWAHDRCPASGIAGGGGDQHPGGPGAGRQLLRASGGAQPPGELEFGPIPPHPARFPLTIELDLRSQAPPRARRSAPAASARRPTARASSRSPSPASRHGFIAG